MQATIITYCLFLAASTQRQHVTNLPLLQGPAAQKLHEEEVQTLVSEAVETKEMQHESEVTQLRQLYQLELQDCEADLRERDRSAC